MTPSDHVRVEIHLSRVRENALRIARDTGVPIIAVVKADAYGLGIERVAEALADLVEGFCTFSLTEVVAANLQRHGKPTLTLGPVAASDDAPIYLKHNVRPSVWDFVTARRLRETHPVLSVDTGMQRFSCPMDHIEQVISEGNISEALTHATRVEQAITLQELLGSRSFKLHAAASALLHERRAYLDAVRPGFALYQGAVRVSTRLEIQRRSIGPVGYTGFASSHHGVILAGYSNGIRVGPCVVNGTRRRVVEVGMQSAYIELGPDDRAGDEVVLLGDQLTEKDVGLSWGCSAQNTMLHLCASGQREYRPS